MIFISHRGNIYGKQELEENKPEYILECINQGYECEIDLWFSEGHIFFGHDLPQYKVPLSFVQENGKYLWVHCKNIEAFTFLHELKDPRIHFFWHQEDDITLTSKNIIWAYPGKQPIMNSIAVMPEINNEKELSSCMGICSDQIKKYKLQYGDF